MALLWWGTFEAVDGPTRWRHRKTKVGARWAEAPPVSEAMPSRPLCTTDGPPVPIMDLMRWRTLPSCRLSNKVETSQVQLAQWSKGHDDGDRRPPNQCCNRPSWELVAQPYPSVGVWGVCSPRRCAGQTARRQERGSFAFLAGASGQNKCGEADPRVPERVSTTACNSSTASWSSLCMVHTALATLPMSASDLPTEDIGHKKARCAKG